MVDDNRVALDGEGRTRAFGARLADLRDFTVLVERTAPQVVVQLINRYFQEMSEGVQEPVTVHQIRPAP